MGCVLQSICWYIADNFRVARGHLLHLGKFLCALLHLGIFKSFLIAN